MNTVALRIMTHELTVNRAPEINQLHQRFSEGLRTTLQVAVQIGELLTAQKAECKHGSWLSWIKANLSFDRKTAVRYMRCYDHREILNVSPTRHLTIEEFARVACQEEQEAAETQQISYISVNRQTTEAKRINYIKSESKPPEPRRITFTTESKPLVAVQPESQSEPGPEPDMDSFFKCFVLDHLWRACQMARTIKLSDDEIVEMLHAILDGKHPELKWPEG